MNRCHSQFLQMGHDQFEENPSQVIRREPKIPRFSLKEMNMKSLDEKLPCNFEQNLGMSSLFKQDLESFWYWCWLSGRLSTGVWLQNSLVARGVLDLFFSCLGVNTFSEHNVPGRRTFVWLISAYSIFVLSIILF